MPTYHTPSSSPSRSVSRSSSLSDTPRRRRNTSTRSRSRRRSPSPSSSRSSSRSSSGSNRASTALKKATSSDTKTESVVKTSLVFLGAVGAATLAAHKFWPKGVTYGEKEEWETKQERKVRKAMREKEEDGGKRGAGDDRSSTASGSRGGRERDRDRDRQRGRERDGPIDGDSRERAGDWERQRQRERVDERDTGRRGVSVGGGYYKREEVIVRGKERAPDRPRSAVREHPREQDGAYVEREQRIDRYITSGRDRDRLDVPVASTVVVDRRRSTGRDADYYPPTQQRYPTTEPARSTAGSDRPRSPRYYDDRDGEVDVVYVRREPAVRGRAYSEAVPVDGGRPRSRYDDDYYR